MNFKKGDKVKVINDGSVYTSYERLARRLGAKKYVDFGDNNIEKNTIGKVINVGKHEDSGSDIALIICDEKEILIDFDGLELIKRGNYKEPKVNFLLQYELEEDPIEEFETIVQVRKRIKELLQRDDLKEDSMKVYEVKNVKQVKINKQIVIK